MSRLFYASAKRIVPLLISVFILSSCASNINSIQPHRYADIEPAKLMEVRTTEKQDALEILFLSDNTMRYKVKREEADGVINIDIPYVVLPSPWEPPKAEHPYLKNLEIKQVSLNPAILQVKLKTSAGINMRSSITAGGDGLRVVLYPDKPETEEINKEGYRLYKLKYADAAQVAAIVQRMIPYGENRIQVNEKQNYILFDNAFESSKHLLKLLSELDKPPHQILLEAEIVEVNVDDLKNLGIAFTSPITTTFQEIQANPPTYSTVDLPIQQLARTPLNLVSAIHFLKENGKARTLANPRVATTDNVEAKVVTTERIPYFITEVQANYTYITKQEFTAGIVLEILPRVNDDGKITTKIQTTVSSITGTTPQGYPKTSSRDVETVLRVMAGQTIIIGGLLEDRVINTTSGVAILGDIPILGRLFRTERTEKKQMELFIFITPYLLEDGEV